MIMIILYSFSCNYSFEAVLNPQFKIQVSDCSSFFVMRVAPNIAAFLQTVLLSDCLVLFADIFLALQ